jgi:hypothetical protein
MRWVEWLSFNDYGWCLFIGREVPCHCNDQVEECIDANCSGNYFPSSLLSRVLELVVNRNELYVARVSKECDSEVLEKLELKISKVKPLI